MAGEPSVPEERRCQLGVGAARKGIRPKTGGYGRLGGVGGEYAEVGDVVAFF